MCAYPCRVYVGLSSHKPGFRAGDLRRRRRGYIRISRIFFLSSSASSDSSAILRLSFSTIDLDVGERRRPLLLLEVEILSRMTVLGL